MDPVVDTHDDGPLEAMPNAVQPTGAEADAFGTGLAPELFPDGAVEEAGAANPVPGQASAELVKQAGGEPDRADTQPDAFLNELPVPPPQFHHPSDGAAAGQENNGNDDDDEDMGDDLFGDAGDDDGNECVYTARCLPPPPPPPSLLIFPTSAVARFCR